MMNTDLTEIALIAINTFVARLQSAGCHFRVGSEEIFWANPLRAFLTQAANMHELLPNSMNRNVDKSQLLIYENSISPEA